MKRLRDCFLTLAILLLPGLPASAYEFTCTQQVQNACGANLLCQLQYFTCCPAADVHRKQDCEMCSGYWIEDSGSCSENDPGAGKGTDALPAIIMYLLG